MSKPIFTIPIDWSVNPVQQRPSIAAMAGEANYGMETFNVDVLRAHSRGKNVKIGIVDTGCDTLHPEFRSRIRAARDFTGSSNGYQDTVGHGTHCLATAAGATPAIGVANEAELFVAKGLDNNGSGLGSWISNAMRWLADACGVDIITMSLGSSSMDPQIDEAGVHCTEKGIWVFAAAGNSGGGTSDIDFPGRLPWAISVAAVDKDFRVASFSSAGASIRTSAPGVNIWSAKARSNGGYVQMSGTSMATPFAAGVGALYRDALKTRGMAVPSTAELIKLLQSDAMDVSIPGVDRRTGPGVIWPRLLANNLIASPPDPDTNAA